MISGKHSRPVAGRALTIAAALMLASLAVAAAAPAAGGGLSQYLAHSGEETGFVTSGKPVSFSTAAAFLQGDPTETADAKTLAGAGFQTALSVTLTGPDKGEAESDVVEMKTSAGATFLARTEVARAHQQGAGSYTAFAVPGVPGAAGYDFSGSANHNANVYWVEGRCTLFLGDFRSVPGSLAPPLIAGVKAIYARTHGSCP